jgi:hypothetical protein
VSSNEERDSVHALPYLTVAACSFRTTTDVMV